MQLSDGATVPLIMQYTSHYPLTLSSCIILRIGVQCASLHRAVVFSLREGQCPHRIAALHGSAALGSHFLLAWGASWCEHSSVVQWKHFCWWRAMTLKPASKQSLLPYLKGVVPFEH